jgi:hypothetical protein
MSITVIRVPSDFEERYKKYRTQLGDKRTLRTLDVVTEAQERATRDLTIVNEQLQGFAKQISASSAIFEQINKQREALDHFQKIADEQHKVIQSWARSVSPMLKIVRDTQEKIDQFGVISKLNDLHEPIVRLATSAMEAQRAVEAFKVADTITVTESVKLEIGPPVVGEVVLPPPRKQETKSASLPANADVVVLQTISDQLSELIGIARDMSQKTGGEDKKHGFPFTIPAGTRWESVYVSFVDDQMVDIRVAGKVHRTGYADMGFANQKTGNPNNQWGLLRVLARYGGELKAADAEATPKVVKQKELLSQRLKDYFSLDTDPFQTYAQAKGYKTKFTLVPPQREITAPTASLEDDDKAYYEELTQEE